MKLPKFEKNNKLFWLYIVLGAIVTIFAIIFAPFWSSVNVPWKNWSQSILNLIIAAFLSLYLFCFLIFENTKIFLLFLKKGFLMCMRSEL